MSHYPDYPIPPITDPMGSTVAKAQPKPHELLFIGNDTVAMYQSSMAKLPEYSTTLPSEVYPGKMWLRRNDGGPFPRHDLSREERRWELCWFAEHPTDPDRCVVHSRQVIDRQAVDLIAPPEQKNLMFP